MRTEAEQRLQAMPDQKTKVIPNQEQLVQLDRDLQFYPSRKTDPLHLTSEQIEDFNQYGYLTGMQIFDANEILVYRHHFDDLLTEVMSAGGGSYSILSAHLRYGKVYDLLTHPRIVGYIRDLLGDDVVAWGSHYFCKLPHDGKIVAWHQDASYWPLTPSKTVTVWLAIDDLSLIHI